MSPSQEYQHRLAARRARHAALLALDARLSYARLAVFVAAFLAGTLAWRDLVNWWWLLAPLALFLWLVRRHDHAIRDRDEASRAVAFYERGLARLEDRWAGGGETGEHFGDPEHLYAADLDLFGRGSLFELLSIARTQVGEWQLAQWLKNPAPPSDVVERQAAVAELAPRVDLRERVALAGAAAGASVNGDALMTWAEQSRQLPGTVVRALALALSGVIVIAAAWWMAGGSGLPLVVIIVIELLLFSSQRGRMHAVLHAAGGWSRDLDVLAQVLKRIEAESFTAPPLSALRARLAAGGVAPSHAIGRLHRLVEMHDWQHNPFVAVIAVPLLWDVHVAFAMEAWRARFGREVRTWLQSVGEFEAISSLATYRFERPDDPFPTLDDGPHALFEGAGLGHPLLPVSRMVRNDVSLGAATQLLIISGSNMSGKSTLLRTVGVNAVLALAGAPVRAAALRLSPLAVGATLRIQDSLQEGRSRFYAEITRIRALADRAGGTPPLLFLLDELFHGTNSHDRLIGAAGVLRSLLDRGAIGLVTTHDLALTAVAGELSSRAVNVHFEDRFEAGEILFDYTMKPGPVTRSNAIALMRAVGLDVPE
ncbi:MAG: DNA mismatch repair protein MutS [Vicinamibacterales bacterium]